MDFEFDTIESSMGKAVADHVNHVHQGGINNADGEKYEQHYCVLKIVGYATTAFKRHQGLGAYSYIYFVSQAFCLVDDLVISGVRPHWIEHNQCKKVITVSWGSASATDSLTYKFYTQSNINSKCYHKVAFCRVVTPNTALVNRLKSSIPKPIRRFSRVYEFPKAASLEEMVQSHPFLKMQIETLMPSKGMRLQDIVRVAKEILLIFYDDFKGKAKLASIFDKAYTEKAIFLRGFRVNSQLNPQLETILKNVQDFDYKEEDDFFFWRIPSQTAEWTAFTTRCSSKPFAAIVDGIILDNPKTKEGLLQWLDSH